MSEHTKEDKQDMLSRLKLMAENPDLDWDFSGNDTNALRYAIECIEELEAVRETQMRHNDDLLAIRAKEPLENNCNFNRVGIKHIEMCVRNVLHKARNKEVHDHMMLAVRHLEDARMRLGKAIQYSGDGVSCYDKGEKPQS